MIERVIIMNTKTKNKRQNRGSHLKNIRGSAFRKKFISEWLDDPTNKGYHYEDAVQAYIKYKANIARQWANPVEELLRSNEPWCNFYKYDDLVTNSRDNVRTVEKALTASTNDNITYTRLNENKIWVSTTEKGWMNARDKYIEELTRPSGQTGKWIKKLKTLCENFQKIKSENDIVPGLKKIIQHCTYKAGDPEDNDKLPLYMYRDVHILYTNIALRLKDYQEFVTEEINNGHKNQNK